MHCPSLISNTINAVLHYYTATVLQCYSATVLLLHCHSAILLHCYSSSAPGWISDTSSSALRAGRRSMLDLGEADVKIIAAVWGDGLVAELFYLLWASTSSSGWGQKLETSCWASIVQLCHSITVLLSFYTAMSWLCLLVSFYEYLSGVKI